MPPNPAATEANQVTQINLATDTNTKLDTLITALTTSNDRLFSLMGAMEDMRDLVIASDGHLVQIIDGQTAMVIAQNASIDALNLLVAASDAQKTEVIGVASKVEQQRVDTLAATETVRLASVDVATKVEQQRVDNLAATEAVRLAVEQHRIDAISATELAQIAQVAAIEQQRITQTEALLTLPH